MTTSQSIFKVLATPTYYSFQTKIGYCGPEQLKVILEATGKTHYKHPSFYIKNVFQKIFGFLQPWQISKQLKIHGFSAKISLLKGKDNQKLLQLKNKLAKGPVILLVGHAYTDKTRFNFLRAILINHYISIWGYNEKEQIFYAYDSSLKSNIKKDIPVGNSIFGYNEIIKLGKFPILGLIRNLYISLG